MHPAVEQVVAVEKERKLSVTTQYFEDEKPAKVINTTDDDHGFLSLVRTNSDTELHRHLPAPPPLPQRSSSFSNLEAILIT